MSQVSRPVQIVLAVVVLFGALWFVALRPHSPSGSSAPAPAPAPASPPASSAQPQGSSLPGGLGGLARAVDKANGAVATSQANANQLQRNSAAASSSQAPAPTTAGSAGTPAQGATSAQPSTTAGAASTSGAKPSAAPGASAAAASRAHAGPAAGSAAASHSPSTSATGAQAAAASPAVEIKTELARGKTVALLFWNPLSSDDQAVHNALLALVKPHGPLVLHVATAADVPAYGTIVTASQVLETPTLLLMRGKEVESITDLQDPSDIRQYVGNVVAGTAGAVQTPKLTAYTPGTSRAAYLAKVNATCRRVNRTAPKTLTITPGETVAQVLQAVESIDSAIITQIARIPAPSADRAFVHNLWVAELRSQKEVSGYVAALAAGNTYAAHNLLLSAESNDDLAGQMALTYGLTDCVWVGAR